MRVINLGCPACGAPLPLGEHVQDRQVALCLYCEAGAMILVGAGQDELRVERFDGKADPNAPDDVHLDSGLARDIKALVFAGRRKEAIALYVDRTGLDEASARSAINQILQRVGSQRAMMRRTPMKPMFMALFAAVPCGAALFGLAFSVPRLLQGQLGAGVGVLGCLGLVAAVFFWLVPHLVSTITLWMGRPGRGRVLHRGIISEELVIGGVVALVRFAVAPDGAGQAPFEAEEVLILLPDSVPKLDPGNVVRVRFSRGSGRVFPTVPMQVLEHQQSGSGSNI